MSWEQREAELEQEVERYQREHDSIITAANKMDPASRHTTDFKVHGTFTDFYITIAYTVELPIKDSLY